MYTGHVSVRCFNYKSKGPQHRARYGRTSGSAHAAYQEELRASEGEFHSGETVTFVNGNRGMETRAVTQLRCIVYLRGETRKRSCMYVCIIMRWRQSATRGLQDQYFLIE